LSIIYLYMHSISVIKPTNKAVFGRLNRLADPPRKLFIRGAYDPSIPAVAIVGSRKHSAYGKQAAEMLASGLARAGVVVISGLAIGIDSVAHAAALEAGGRTIAVMPGGVDRVYPASHRQLAEKMVVGSGALVGEYPPATLPAKHHFVARNRIVAALSDAVLVIEAAARSGTLITAEYALDIGVPVMAVPGPITSPTSKGTNGLIGMGAKLVANVEDVLDELGISWEQAAYAYNAKNKLGQDIISCLSAGPMSAQELAMRTNSELPELNRELTHLELDSAIVNIGNNTWSLKPGLPS
jgi:DNA processing protein